MKKGKTSSGFEFEVEELVFDDMEVVEILADLDDKPLRITKLIDRVLGQEQKKKLYDHVRADDGRVPVDAVNTEITEIFEIVGDESKN